jgi:8-amino-7-oxononanoate synthase
VPDFTSALYLGLRHATGALQPWARLTRGAPAALREPPGAAAAERGLAVLVGTEAAVLAPSTVHLAVDLGTLADPERDALLVDAGAYPILRWGVERARARGVPVAEFAHHDCDALRRALAGREVGGRRPLVVTDGVCPACGGPAPLQAYRELAASRRGRLVVDDTQALGVLGRGPDRRRPYGSGGGGSLRWHGMPRAHVVVVCSAAKALGAPVAALCGEAATVSEFRARSQTRVHCSPPSAAAIAALRAALTVNRTRGDHLRRVLLALVTRLRAGLERLGLPVAGGPFPVQALPWLPPVQAGRLHSRLLERGVATVQLGDGHRSRIVFLLTARHRESDVDAALAALAECWPARRSAVAA